MSCKVLNVATSILHVLAECTGRWHKPPDPIGFASICDPELIELVEESERVGLQDWGDAIWSQLIRAFLCRIPESFRRFDDHEIKNLARHCCDFFSEIDELELHYAPLWSHEYPDSLRQINDPPLGLMVAGNISLFTKVGISVVGSRKAARWALDWAMEFGRLAAREGIPVISGGAFGCDAAVHCGMLQELFDSVPAVTVLAGGLGQPYPIKHVNMFSDIVMSGGCLVSERRASAGCRPRDFLARNRIIAGMSPITIIVQAAQRSGAMVTGRAAADQGRDVWVVTPPAYDVRADGNLALLDEGAVALEDPADALGYFKIYSKNLRF